MNLVTDKLKLFNSNELTNSCLDTLLETKGEKKIFFYLIVTSSD